MSEKRIKPKALPQHEQVKRSHWLDRFGSLWLRFDRFGWDVLGILLLSAGMITSLGLAGLSAGNLMEVLVWLLKRWLGWGSYLFVVVLIALGVLTLLRRLTHSPQYRLGRILALEGLFFSLLAVLSISGGRSVTRADQGLDGGLIGWGLATLMNVVLPQPVVAILLIILCIVFAVSGFGLSSWFVRKFENWLLNADQPRPAAVSAQLSGQPVSISRSVESEAPSQEGSLEKDRSLLEGIPRKEEGLPPLHILMHEQSNSPDEENIHSTAEVIEQTLREFGIPVRVVGFRVGPTVTQFAVEPGFVEKEAPDGQIIKQKVRVSQISALSRDLALSLSAERLRIQAPVPGRSFVGIEVPNRKISVVRLRPLLESENFRRSESRLAIALGRDVSGQPVIADLARMPHLLIAGTTGSGKSVCIAALAVCLVMNNRPSDLRLAMMDPKMVELIRFNGLPHLFGKVETDVDRMLGVLNWALAEMDSRYRLLETARARDIEVYNRRAERRKQPPLPRIVILIDELADLMMSAPDQTEHNLVRLAQMARATGIHLVIATQRPSTDVVTGLIKANFPARISFNVASSIDSRVILDSTGAETLMGRGDMLFLNPEAGVPLRAQGVMVTDHEIQRVVNFWQETNPELESSAPWEELIKQDEETGGDNLLKQAIAIVKQTQRASASLLQRRLHIGYPRAARLIDEMEALGVVGPVQGGGREREVLWSPDDADLGEDIAPEEDDF
ncbi:MAG: hypothetical protein HPY59_15905 [Anaerolineae bacterium]|nr:hypothetical protein [Anaerolineae bacterium]